MTTESQPLTGRDLDAAIAEKLFGWRWTTAGLAEHTASLVPPSVVAGLLPEFRFTSSQVAGREHKLTGRVPCYSSSWDDMRLVVEEMQRRGYPRLEMKWREYQEKWAWVAAFWPQEGEEGYFKDSIFSFGAHTSELLPTAVCVAALKTLQKMEE